MEGDGGESPIGTRGSKIDAVELRLERRPGWLNSAPIVRIAARLVFVTAWRPDSTACHSLAQAELLKLDLDQRKWHGR